jgi:hypothetical protein
MPAAGRAGATIAPHEGETLAKPITAYLSEDGQVHRSQEEAEWSDYGLALRKDIKDFMTQQGITDADSTMGNLIAKWDLWRLGGYPGWLAGVRGEEAPPAVPPLLAVPAAAPVEVPAPVQLVPAPMQRAPAPADKQPLAFRRRVAVIALPQIHHRTIENEFGKEFKLLLLDAADSMNKLESLRAYHKVIVMARRANGKTVQILRGIGQEPLQINGDLDALRDALTAMYLSSAA